MTYQKSRIYYTLKFEVKGVINNSKGRIETLNISE